MSLTASVGLKRRIASITASLITLLSTIPIAAPALPVLNWIAGLIGSVGVVHAGFGGTLKKYLAATLSSLLSAFIFAAGSNPAIAPYVHTLQTLAGLLGVVAASK